MRKLIVAVAIAALIYFFFGRKPKEPVAPAVAPVHKINVTKAPTATAPPPTPPSTVPPPQKIISVTPPRAVQPSDPKKKHLTLPYVLEGDLAIVQGDVLIGTIANKDAPEHGVAEVPEFKLWPSSTIAYHIQPTLTNPDRVRAALDMFQGTNVQFVPYTNQENALVFEEGSGVCKSYVGMMGGLQPVYLPAECGPHEIAHEVMHALGFIHEQNRYDRDEYIQVNFDNIEDNYKFNFDKLPQDFMKVSGLSSFDYESIMIYPNMMFAKGSRPTMQSVDRSKPIQPSFGLSKSDIDRINQAYK